MSEPTMTPVSEPQPESAGKEGGWTPGPWGVGDGFEVYAITAYRSVAMVLGDGRAEANANLIAAAPDMIEALFLIDAYLYATAPDSNERQIVRAAISRAQGDRT